jgi:hypothetical protein
MMKTMLPLAVLAAVPLFLAGCASAPSTEVPPQSAGLQRNCRVALAPVARINADPSKETDMDRAEARSRLAATSLRLGMLRSPPGQTGLIEDVLRDC